MTANKLYVQYNNQGVDFLEKGRYGDAISVFKNALHTLMKAQKEAPQHNHISASIDGPDFTPWSPSEKRLDQILQIPRDESSYVYGCAFRISRSPRHEESTASSVQDTMVVIFNLSLVFHFLHLTRTSGQRDPKNLTKALHYYSMAQALILSEENQGMNNDPSILLILMASCNNMGQLQHSVRKSDDAVASMKLLSSTLAFCHTHRYFTIDPEDLRGFSMNIMFLIEPILAPAA
eukprot:CAMPEP_0119028360 /NCGR_PEP_ID=MMETSP1176-20130426/38729_1 /TAXON_ID=265551 /ORGANISM="Synedropsis recta cf, Strain CCMP1620" /LENGTH=233 /DNA_ID=CAMNT_0006984479 /DNA_START=584 /DNA_END=1285 /DNA_ORIENTATION=+